MHHQYTYAKALAAAQQINWQLDDLIGGDKRLDFSRPFLPESLARTSTLAFLSRDEQRVANQIRGYGYLCLFGLVEEFVLPFVLDQVRPQLGGDAARARALLQFASEEAKHIELFRLFRAEFERGFGYHCGVIGPGEAIAREILRHQPLAVALAVLHIEWMTQRHYLESVADQTALDPQFKSLLKHHFLEEVQHAKLDTLIVETLAAERSPAEIAGAVEEYLEIGVFLDQGLRQQLDLDLETLQRSTGRRLSTSEMERYVAVQQPALRWTFLGSGMTHPNVLRTLQALSPAARERVEQVAPAFC
jgi:hypothetical protein